MLSSTSADSRDALANLLVTATVVLDTDRRAAKNCIRRAATLLGIDLSPGESGAAGSLRLQGVLAPCQAKYLKSYIDGKLMRRRILRAQKLMLTSRLPLSQVAVECGLCDQAHLTRLFRRIVGTSPCAWRRQLAAGPLRESRVDGPFATAATNSVCMGRAWKSSN
jgi:AraC family transcriptional regulator